MNNMFTDLKKHARERNLINTYTVMTRLHKHLVRAKGLLHKAQKDSLKRGGQGAPSFIT